jgi:hypothetical protein
MEVEMRSRANGRRKLVLAAAVAVAAGLTAGPGQANEVTVNESVCGKFDCIDGYEIKCKQPSRYLCVTLDASPSDDAEGVDFRIATVEVAPAPGLGHGYMRSVGGNGARRNCLARPASLPDGTMTALAIVGSSTMWNGAKPYRLKAECSTFSGGVQVSKSTQVKKKRDE